MRNNFGARPKEHLAHTGPNITSGRSYLVACPTLPYFLSYAPFLRFPNVVDPDILACYVRYLAIVVRARGLLDTTTNRNWRCRVRLGSICDYSAFDPSTGPWVCLVPTCTEVVGCVLHDNRFAANCTIGNSGSDGTSTMVVQRMANNEMHVRSGNGLKTSGWNSRVSSS